MHIHRRTSIALPQFSFYKFSWWG